MPWLKARRPSPTSITPLPSLEPRMAQNGLPITLDAFATGENHPAPTMMSYSSTPVMTIENTPPVPGSASLNNGYSRPKSKKYSPSDWESKRSLIKQLYMENPLKEVMRIMGQEHNFYATRKMYVARIESWGLGKNCTKKRVLDFHGKNNERVHNSKIVKLGGEGKVIDEKRIQNYLKRKNKDIELGAAENIVYSDAEISPETSTSTDSNSGPSEIHTNSSLRSSSTESSKNENYEVFCPYLPWKKKFRLIEDFPNGTTYQGDSLGFRLYIAEDEERPCTENCYCRQQNLTTDFSFLVRKYSDQMDITIFSDALYTQLCGYEGLQEAMFIQEKKVNGLVLLKHYHFLNEQLNFLRCAESLGSPSTQPVLSEMELLVDGLLADGEIFKSFGYETLYERDLLDFNTWKKFQQDKLERNLSEIEDAFYEIDGDEEDGLSVPLHSPDFSKECEMQENPEEPLDPVQQQAYREVNFFAICPQRELADAFSNHHGNTIIKDAETTATGGHQEVKQPPYDRGEHIHKCSFKEMDAGLLKAANAGLEETVRLLLDRGASINGNGSHNPLAQAAGAGHDAIVQLLLDRGALINGDNYRNPLAQAAGAGHEAIVQLLLDRGASIDGATYSNPLAEAAGAGHKAIVRLLLDRGASIDGTDGWNPLARAAEASYEAIVQLLLDRGASKDDAMVACADVGHISAVQRLLELGADVNAVTSLGTALSAGAKNNDFHLVNWLLSQGAEMCTAACILQSSRRTKSKAAWLHRLAVRLQNSKRGGLMSQDSETAQKFRILRRHFVSQCVLMRNAAQRSSTTFRELAQVFQNHRDTWESSIRTVRTLNRGERPTLANTLAFFSFVKAISETLQNDSDTRPLVQDIFRWELLFQDESDREAYKDAMHSLWGIAFDENMSGEGQADPELFNQFFSLASTLIRDAREYFDLDENVHGGLEQSQHAWQSRNHPMSDIEFRNDISAFHVPESSGQQTFDITYTKPPDPDPGISSKLSTLQNAIHHNAPTVANPVVVFLLFGAAFAIVIIFIQWLQNALSNCKWMPNGLVDISTLQQRYWNLATFMGLDSGFGIHSVHATNWGVDDHLFGDFFDFDSFGLLDGV